MIKKDGTRQPFDPAKLKLGIQKACEKRPVSTDQINDIVDNIHLNAISVFDDEIPASEIGRMVLENLRDVDQVAYARFSCVYHEINDLESFAYELERLLSKLPEGKAD